MNLPQALPFIYAAFILNGIILTILIHAVCVVYRDQSDLFKYLDDLSDEIDKLMKDREDLWYYLNANYYDYYEHLYNTYHLLPDDNGVPRPSKPQFVSLEEELRFLKYRDWVKEESIKRNLPFPSRDGEDSYDSSEDL